MNWLIFLVVLIWIVGQVSFDEILVGQTFADNNYSTTGTLHIYRWTTSGKTCADLSCHIKLISKSHSPKNFNCDLKQTLKSVKVNSTLLFEIFLLKFQCSKVNTSLLFKANDRSNYKQIFKIDNIDLCKELENLKNTNWLETLFNLANGTFPGNIPEKWP